MSFMIILKVTKSQSFTLSLEDRFLEKQQGGGSNWPPVFLGLKMRTVMKPFCHWEILKWI